MSPPCQFYNNGFINWDVSGQLSWQNSSLTPKFQNDWQIPCNYQAESRWSTPNIPLMYNQVLWNRFLKKKKKKYQPNFTITPLSQREATFWGPFRAMYYINVWSESYWIKKQKTPSKRQYLGAILEAILESINQTPQKRPL